jgi:hypothetical protein
VVNKGFPYTFGEPGDGVRTARSPSAVFGDGFDTFPAATGGNFLVDVLPNLF